MSSSQDVGRSPSIVSVASEASQLGQPARAGSRRQLDIERHQKMQGVSLRVGLQRGFIDLVGALDILSRAVDPMSTALSDVLQDRTQQLLETKGVEAIYWLQFMKEVTHFIGEDLLKAIATSRRQAAPVPTEGPTEAPPPMPEPTGSAAQQMQAWFASHRGGALSLEELERKAVEFAGKLESNCDDHIARLHVHYGKLLDDSRMALLACQEKSEVVAEKPVETEERGFSFQGHLDAADFFQSLHRVVGAKELEGEENGRPKERFLGSRATFCVIIPPKIIRLNLPLDEEVVHASGLWPASSCCPVQVDGIRERKTFHVQLPQQELRVPSFIIERYAREVLFKGFEVKKIEEKPPSIPVIHLEEEEGLGPVEFKPPVVTTPPQEPVQEQPEEAEAAPEAPPPAKPKAKVVPRGARPLRRASATATPLRRPSGAPSGGTTVPSRPVTPSVGTAVAKRALGAATVGAARPRPALAPPRARPSLSTAARPAGARPSTRALKSPDIKLEP